MTDAPRPLSPAKLGIRRARIMAIAGVAIPQGKCLAETRKLFGIPALHPSAAVAWAYAKNRKHQSDPAQLRCPDGALIYWTGGSGGHGHIAVAQNIGGRVHVWTTDYPTPGRWARVPLVELCRKWPSLRLAGWADNVNGSTVLR